jgi:molybdenum cofactor cytidylyltransferase
VIAVLRPGCGALAGRLAAIGCEPLPCAEADAGMGHSLACGVLAAPDAAGWLVALADMPFIAPASHHAVATNLRAGASLAASEFAGRRGHPVGFAGRCRDQLAQLGGDQGGKSILDAHAQAWSSAGSTIPACCVTSTGRKIWTRITPGSADSPSVSSRIKYRI